MPPLVRSSNRAERVFYGLAASVLLVAFAYVAWVFFVPAHSGVDQNGYLVGGRQIYRTGTMKLAPRAPGHPDEFDPHQFVGQMWVGVDYGKPTERFYPKYPIGLPLLYAAALWLGGTTTQGAFAGWGVYLAFWISPLCMTLAMVATYLLIRLVAEPFLALVGAVLVGTSPTTLLLTNNPNSHASALCCVAWGMYLLLRWWQVQGLWRALLGGFLLGYAATIRYTEGTLILPILLVVVFRLQAWRFPQTISQWFSSRLDGVGPLTRWQRLRNILRHPVTQSLAVLLGWAIPVGFLLIYNRLAMNTWTGYDPTNESRGFTFDFASDNWETMLRQLGTNNGLFLIFPVALLGLGWMFHASWRLAMVMAAWILPCLAAYTFYYWAPDGSHTGYLRFFLTIFPALAVCALWLVSHVSNLIGESRQPRSWWRAAVILLVVAGSGYALRKWGLSEWFDTYTGKDSLIIWAALVALCAVAAALTALVLAGRPVIAATGMVASIAVGVQLYNSIYPLEAEHYQRLMLDWNTREILAQAKAGSVLVNADRSVLHNLQFSRDYLLYVGDTFAASNVANFGRNLNMDDPQGLDPGRRKGLAERFAYLGLDKLDSLPRPEINKRTAEAQQQLDDQQRQIVTDALKLGQEVYLIDPPQRAPQGWRRGRPVPAMASKLTSGPAQKDLPLYSDITRNWRAIIIPKIEVDKRQEDVQPRRGRPRAQRPLLQAARYEGEWRMVQVSLNELPVSEDRKAQLEFEAQQKAQKEKDAAAEKAKRDAEDKLRQDRLEQEKQRQERLAAAQQLVQKLTSDRQQLERAVGDSRTALDKLKADIQTAQRDAQQSRADKAAAEQQAKIAQATKATAEQQTQKALADQLAAERAAQAALAQQKQLEQQRQALQQNVEEVQAELARLEAQRLSAETALKAPPVLLPATTPAPATQPGTAP